MAIGITADFQVRFVAQFQCARCLDSFSEEFNTHLQLIFVHGKDPHTQSEKVTLKKDDIDKVYYTGSYIDLSIGIREAIVLSIPLAPLCKDDCRGLCPVCGMSKNTGECECTIEKVGLFTPASHEKKKRIKRRRKR